jgi:hypothetical protein
MLLQNLHVISLIVHYISVIYLRATFALTDAAFVNSQNCNPVENKLLLSSLDSNGYLYTHALRTVFSTQLR